MVVRPCRVHQCGSRLMGSAVDITELAVPLHPLEVLLEVAEGPAWLLKEHHACPQGVPGCPGLDRMPDRCLMPFSPGSKLEPEGEGAAPGAGGPVVEFIEGEGREHG